MTAADIRARGDGRLADARERLAALETSAPRDRDVLLAAVNELQLALSNIQSDVSVLLNVHPDPRARAECEATQRESTKLSVRVNQSRPIYDALSTLDLGDLDPAGRRAVELTLRDMRRAGVALDPTRRERAQDLRKRITELSQAYGRNI